MSVRAQIVAERGASAVLIAASMLLLMGFAAIAVDAGQGMSERRQAQASADFGALAALQFAENCQPSCTVAAAATNGANEAVSVVNENLNNPPTLAEWAACSDATRPAAYTLVSSVSPCISFTSNLDQSRVVLPRVSVDTYFARALGFNDIGVGAIAEAQQTSGASSEVIPFSAPSPGYACLFTNQGSQAVAPCDGPDQGNFGYLDLKLYGNDELGTPEVCANNPFNANERVPIHTVLGIDHTLWEYGNGAGQSNAVVDDHAACPNRSARVTQIDRQPGTSAVAVTLTDGLLNGITAPVAAPGRLTCPTAGCGDSVRSWRVDDTPFWSFLVNPFCDPSGGSTPPAGVSGQVNTRDEVTACLAAWPAGQQLVTDAIAEQNRFGAVPVLQPNGPPTSKHLITDFLPVYLETIYLGQCSAGTCRTVHSPGESGNGNTPCPPLTAAVTQCGFNTNGQNRVEGLTAFVLRVDWLSPALQEFFPGQPGVIRYGLIR